MRLLFADTSFLIALLHRRDGMHGEARALYDELLEQPSARIVVSDLVFMETLTRLAKFGPFLRQVAIRFVEGARSDGRFMVVPMTTELFDQGLSLFRRREDKAYSMVDCTSMQICKRLSITEILTADHDFEQEGFTILLKP